MKKLGKNIKKVVSRFDYEYGQDEDILIFVKAVDKQHALKIIDDAGYPIEGRKIISIYDCTGQWFWSPITTRNITWSASNKCYVVKYRAYKDI